MIINKLRLENFGLFSGIQEIDLSPSKDKKIIIIGGKNGNGKTTLFEAIKLCLYGQRAVHERYNKKLYEKHLIERIHHNPNLVEQAVYASVGLEFQHAHLGKVDNYFIKRYWENNGKGFHESFLVRRNEKELDEVGSEQWQEFINDIIPPGLSQLFFFDGEKIQALAEDIEDNRQLAESFKALLGIDLVEKLESDLEIYALKQIKTEGVKDLQKKIESLEIEEKELERAYDDLLQDRAQIQSKLDQAYKNIADQELVIAKEGGIFAQKRDELKKQKTMVETEIIHVEEQLREFSADILPFVFTHKLSRKLKESLAIEETYRNEATTQKYLKDKINHLRKEFVKDSFWEGTDLKKQHILKLSEKIIGKLSLNIIGTNHEFEPIHNLSSNEYHKLISLIDQAANEGTEKLKTFSKKYEDLIKKQRGVTKELALAPEDNSIAKEIEAINRMHHNLGVLQQQQKSKNEVIKNLEFNLERNRRELRKLAESFNDKNNLSIKLELINKVKKTLQEYHKELELQKIKEFATLFIESYNLIARKKNVFKRIEVDPKDYSVALFKADDRKTSKSQLSAGEKQIYAIAILWTLTKISGRPLPFIIDTPLGRLDSDHRNKLVHNFFPESSHQLIILSTDTEIDHEYLSSLAPYTVRTFNLEYDGLKTSINRGYFWSK